MPDSLTSPPVRPVLGRLFQAAHSDDPVHWVTVRERHPDGLAGLSAREQAAEMTDYLAYVRDPAHGYLSVSFPESDGLEITCRV